MHVKLDPDLMADAAVRVARQSDVTEHIARQLPSGMPIVLPARIAAHVHHEVATLRSHAVALGAEEHALAKQLADRAALLLVADGGPWIARRGVIQRAMESDMTGSRAADAGVHVAETSTSQSTHTDYAPPSTSEPVTSPSSGVDVVANAGADVPVNQGIEHEHDGHNHVRGATLRHHGTRLVIP